MNITEEEKEQEQGLCSSISNYHFTDKVTIIFINCGVSNDDRQSRQRVMIFCEPGLYSTV